MVIPSDVFAGQSAAPAKTYRGVRAPRTHSPVRPVKVRYVNLTHLALQHSWLETYHSEFTYVRPHPDKYKC